MREQEYGEKGITDLPDLVAALPARDRERFERIFVVDSSIGRLNPTPAMSGWIEEYFGSVDAVRQQKVVRVTNLVTMEGSFFNELRSRRPLVTGGSTGGDWGAHSGVDGSSYSRNSSNSVPDRALTNSS